MFDLPIFGFSSVRIVVPKTVVLGMRHATSPKVGYYRQIIPVFLVLKLAFFYSYIKPIKE